MEAKFLSAAEAAQYLGYSRWTLYGLCSQKLIKHSKPRGKLRFAIKDLDSFQRQNPRRVVPHPKHPEPPPGKQAESRAVEPGADR